jgi:O-antigen ligase
MSDAGAARRPVVSFWLSVAVLLVFSQIWVSVFESPYGLPPDPAVSARLRTVYLPTYGLILLLCAPRLGAIARLLARAPALAGLMLLALLSVAWTIDLEQTERRLVALFLTTVFGLYLAHRFTWPEITQIFGTVFLVIVALSFVYVFFLPLYGRMQVDFPGAWRGVYDHKNMLGYVMSVALAAFGGAFLFNPDQRPLWTVAAAGALLLLCMSTSKTALVAAALAFGAVLIPIAGRRGPAAAVAATLACGIVLYVLAMVLLLDGGVFFKALGKDESFTGRTKIWSAVLKVISERPLLGFGYGSIWENRDVWSPLLRIERRIDFYLPEAHNAWLQIALDLGSVGAALWTFAFLGPWARTLAHLYTRPANLFAFPFLIVFSLHALTEAGALAQNDLVWILFTLVSVRLAVGGPVLVPRPSPARSEGAAPADYGTLPAARTMAEAAAGARPALLGVGLASDWEVGENGG